VKQDEALELLREWLELCIDRGVDIPLNLRCQTNALLAQPKAAPQPTIVDHTTGQIRFVERRKDKVNSVLMADCNDKRGVSAAPTKLLCWICQKSHVVYGVSREVCVSSDYQSATVCEAKACQLRADQYDIDYGKPLTSTSAAPDSGEGRRKDEIT
jgi:hypothetical protein